MKYIFCMQIYIKVYCILSLIMKVWIHSLYPRTTGFPIVGGMRGVRWEVTPSLLHPKIFFNPSIKIDAPSHGEHPQLKSDATI